MLDLYGLGTDFPGMPIAGNLGSLEKAVTIEEAVKRDIVAELPDFRPDLRFLPYIQLHEYEGLLFSDPTAFAFGIGHGSLGQQFQLIRDQFPTPEDINDNPNGAPSEAGSPGSLKLPKSTGRDIGRASCGPSDNETRMPALSSVA